MKDLASGTHILVNLLVRFISKTCRSIGEAWKEEKKKEKPNKKKMENERCLDYPISPIQSAWFALADSFNQAQTRARVPARRGSMRVCHKIALTSAISHLECIVNSNGGLADSVTRSLAARVSITRYLTPTIRLAILHSNHNTARCPVIPNCVPLLGK